MTAKAPKRHNPVDYMDSVDVLDLLHQIRSLALTRQLIPSAMIPKLTEQILRHKKALHGVIGREALL